MTTTTSKKPTHAIFHVTGKDDKARWTRVGAAWAHKDGKGFNLDLELVPMKAGRFVIRENRAEDGTRRRGSKLLLSYPRHDAAA